MTADSLQVQPAFPHIIQDTMHLTPHVLPDILTPRLDTMIHGIPLQIPDAPRRPLTQRSTTPRTKPLTPTQPHTTLRTTLRTTHTPHITIPLTRHDTLIPQQLTIHITIQYRTIHRRHITTLTPKQLMTRMIIRVLTTQLQPRRRTIPEAMHPELTLINTRTPTQLLNDITDTGMAEGTVTVAIPLEFMPDRMTGFTGGVDVQPVSEIRLRRTQRTGPRRALHPDRVTIHPDLRITTIDSYILDADAAEGLRPPTQIPKTRQQRLIPAITCSIQHRLIVLPTGELVRLLLDVPRVLERDFITPRPAKEPVEFLEDVRVLRQTGLTDISFVLIQVAEVTGVVFSHVRERLTHESGGVVAEVHEYLQVLNPRRQTIPIHFESMRPVTIQGVLVRWLEVFAVPESSDHSFVLVLESSDVVYVRHKVSKTAPLIMVMDRLNVVYLSGSDAYTGTDDSAQLAELPSQIRNP